MHALARFHADPYCQAAESKDHEPSELYNGSNRLVGVPLSIWPSAAIPTSRPTRMHAGSRIAACWRQSWMLTWEALLYFALLDAVALVGA